MRLVIAIFLTVAFFKVISLSLESEFNPFHLSEGFIFSGLKLIVFACVFFMMTKLVQRLFPLKRRRL